MSDHSEDPVSEESKRFFTFFNLSMILVAITGVEIVIIYVQTFEGKYIIGILFVTSILKFIGVIWWFMHLKWDKLLNTILFLMGLVIAIGTYFAVMYMTDEHPVVEEFAVAPLDVDWNENTHYKKGDYVSSAGSWYQAALDHISKEGPSNDSVNWLQINGIPHEIKWKVSTGDLVEISSKKPENPFFHWYEPSANVFHLSSSVVNEITLSSIVESGHYMLTMKGVACVLEPVEKKDDEWTKTVSENDFILVSGETYQSLKDVHDYFKEIDLKPVGQIVEGSKVSILAQSATSEDFKIKVRSEAFWVEKQ